MDGYLLVLRYSVGDVPIFLGTEEQCLGLATDFSPEGAWALARTVCRKLDWPEPQPEAGAWSIVRVSDGFPVEAVEVAEIS